MGWRWRNVPVPEAHVAGLVLGLSLHMFVTPQSFGNLQLLWIVGWTLIAAGILLGAWTVGVAGNTVIENPSELVTSGPFAYSRNPMYVAWTAVYLGIAFLTNSIWLLLLLPIVLVVTHLTVRREERTLERAFGDQYREYKNDVRRYV